MEKVRLTLMSEIEKKHQECEQKTRQLNTLQQLQQNQNTQGVTIYTCFFFSLYKHFLKSKLFWMTQKVVKITP